MYWKLVEKHIGPKRWKKVQKWEQERFIPNRMYLSDWLRIEENLKGEK
jgi:hypothetical protein